MRNKKIILILILIFTLLITACSSSNDSDVESQQSTDHSQGEIGYPDEDFIEKGEAEDASLENIQADEIITTVAIEMQTKDFTPTTEKLTTLIDKYKGFIENSSISYNEYVYSDGLKYAYYSIRIPSDSLDAFIDEIIDIGNIISESKNKEDISKNYRDTESRLRVLETKEERILALLEKAENMEDIIVLENQLSDVIYQKESLNQDLTSMDDKVDYSTVDLNIEEVAKLTAGGNSKTPFIEKIKTAFKDSFYFFTRNSGELVLALIYFLPYAFILAVIGYIVYRLNKKRRKSSNKAKSKDE